MQNMLRFSSRLREHVEKLIWFGGAVKVYKLRAEGKKHVLPAVFSVHRKMLQVIIKYSKNLILHSMIRTNTVNTDGKQSREINDLDFFVKSVLVFSSLEITGWYTDLQTDTSADCLLTTLFHNLKLNKT